MKHITVRQITFSALVGAMYVTLCYFGNIFGLNFGIFQCRFAEALTVLPFLCPTAAWGLFAGCILSNLLSPYGLPDLIFGSSPGRRPALPPPSPVFSPSTPSAWAARSSWCAMFWACPCSRSWSG